MKKGWFTVTLVCLVSITQAIEVNFTQDQGYSADSDLVLGNDAWKGNPGNILTQQGVTLSAEQWKTSFYRTAFPCGSKLTTSIDFSFKELKGDDFNNDVISLMICNGFDTQKSFRARLDRIPKTGQYRLEFSNDLKECFSGTPFDAANLGLNNPNSTTDTLTLTCSASPGYSAQDWSVTVELYNGSTLVDKMELTGVASDESLFSRANYTCGFSSSLPETVTGATEKQIHTFKINTHVDTLGLLASF